jgi:hypothetical protein
MTVRALSSMSASLPVAGTWYVVVEVLDADGERADAVPVVTITPPAGGTETPTVETVETGVYRVSYVVAAAGRYVARVVEDEHGAADFAAYVTAVTTAADMPTAATYRDYDEDSGGSWSDTAIQGALDAEAAAQRGVCRVGAVYPADLREALHRRVMGNLARRGLPLAVLQGDAEAGSTSAMPPGRDPEVRRLEGPHRKLVMG